MNPRLILAILVPFIACGAQWLLWDAWIKPYVWFLFFPAAFFSAWLGGLRGGLAGTVTGALLVWFVFIPPQFSFELRQASAGASIVLFVIMGGLFAWVFERLAEAQRRTGAALAETRAANDKISALYRRTLELDELKNQFFANVSHELRTPLTLIMAPLERRLATVADTEPARQEDEMMLRNARLLYRHVSDLLDAAKLEAGRMQVDYARLDIAELVRAMASHFDSMARERGIDYAIETPAVQYAEVDGDKLQRILLNLLSNAFKFTADGGCISLSLAIEDDLACIELRDNGPGVPADMRAAVFERFRQVEGGASRRHGGTGLGLAIVKEFAELHGGSARVDDAPGGGARFTVCLPLMAPVGTALAPAAGRVDRVIERAMVDALRPEVVGHNPPPPGNAPLVLVVEDNLDMNAFIAASLRARYRVATALDGQSGLQKALSLNPDLILCDVMMPVMSGDAMVLELLQRPEMAGVPIIMLTAKADDALRLRLLQAGVQDYLNKPFKVEELLARVGGLLAERQRAGDALRASEDRFEATFEQAAVGIALVATDGHWLRVNRKLCEIVGYTPDELMTKTFQDITHPDDLEADLGQVRRMLAREIDSYAMEKRCLHKNGGIVWINLTVTLIWRADGTPDYFISVIEDITARKQAEAALQVTEHRYREVVENANSAILHWSSDGTITFFNEYAQRLFGWSADEIVGRHVSILVPDQSTDGIDLSNLVQDITTHPERYLSNVNENVCRDGRRLWMNWTNRALRDDLGRVTGLLAVGNDISALKQAEEELKRRNEELERFDRASVGRELEMIRLKRQVNELSVELGRAAPHDLAFVDGPAP